MSISLACAFHVQNNREEEALVEGDEEGGDALDFSEGDEDDSEEAELSGTAFAFTLPISGLALQLSMSSHQATIVKVELVP